MHTSPLGSRSEWWGECWKGWRQRGVAGWVVWAAFVCSTLSIEPGFSRLVLQGEVEVGAGTPTWTGGKNMSFLNIFMVL